MREELARVVFPVLAHVLALKDRLVRGEAADFSREQTYLRALLADSDRLGVRYPLVYWGDEIFISTSSWTEAWRNNSLELFYYQDNNGGYLFWEKARQAEAQGETDMVEVFYLCVMLGFRGNLRDQPDQLRPWRQHAEQQIFNRQREPYQSPREREPTPYVPPLRGKKAFHHMLLVAWLVLGMLIPATTFFLLRGP